MAVTRDDAVDVIFDILAGDLDFFDNQQNRRAGVELLIRQSPEVRKILDETLSLLRTYENDLDDVKDALSGAKTIERLLEPDVRNLRDRILVELPEAAAQPLQDFEAERTANTQSANSTAIKMLEAESVVDPLNEIAVRISPSVTEAVAATPAEDLNVFEKGIDNFIASTVPSEVRSAYESIMEEVRAPTTAYPSPEVDQARRIGPATVGEAEDEEPALVLEREPALVSERAGEMLVDGRPQPAKPVPLGGAHPLTGATGPPLGTDDSDVGDLPDLGGIDPGDHSELMDELYAIYGIRAAFWSLDSNKLQIGLDGSRPPKPVSPDDPSAVRVQHLLEYLVENKITADVRVRAAVEQTPWFQTTNASMREFDANYGGLESFLDLNIGNQRDKLGDIVDKIETGFRQLGVQVSEERIIEIAATIDYLGYDMDNDEIYSAVMREAQEVQYQFDAATASFTEFAGMRDSVSALARSYYINLPSEMSAGYAEQLFTGDMTEAQLQMIFREQASARFSNDVRVQNALNAGLTLEQYFAPYAGELEAELGRPVDLFSEFPEVLEMMGTDGVARPMTYAEMRTFAREQPEWAQSTKGQDAAYDMAFGLGKLFGVTS